jgi:translation initiation factor IF-3
MHGVRGLFAHLAGSQVRQPHTKTGRHTGPESWAGEATQGGHISVELRINERIRVPEVRLVGPNGEQVGIVAVNDALRLAQEADLDLVEVAPMARPPVCKLMDYGKFKYESALKARESRKNQAQTVIKEIKLRPKIDPHDYGTKKGHVERFLRAGDKVKVTIMFRGREQSRPELGFRLLQRLATDVEELGFVEAAPKQDGRNMIMVVGPHRRKSETRPERPQREGRHADRGESHLPEAQPSELDSAVQEPVEQEPAEQEPAEQEPAGQEAAAQEPTAPAASASTPAPANGAHPGTEGGHTGGTRGASGARAAGSPRPAGNPRPPGGARAAGTRSGAATAAGGDSAATTGEAPAAPAPPGEGAGDSPQAPAKDARPRPKPPVLARQGRPRGES